MEKNRTAMKAYTLYYMATLCLALASCTTSVGISDSAPSGTGQGGSMARFAAQGDHLYAVTNDALKVFDISNAASPKYIPGKDQWLSFGTETIFPMDTLLFIGSQTGMYIYNISRPDFPQQLSYIAHITSCDPVVASGNYAYVTLNSESMRCGRNANVLNIYNITDLSQPELVRTITGFTSPKGLAVNGTRLYICDNGLKVYDISNPEKPQWIDDLTHIPGMSNIQAYDVISLGNLILLSSPTGLYQFSCKGEKLEFVSSININQ